ncbi:hypothetical protein FS749_006617 [Ceratobasidium sp. UAMH 11750]|nr:hypothetical protein FS749_006617 [Ceratobasidium sp. UAMH 11750]
MGRLVDIDAAITHQSQAVSLTPEGHSAKSTRLNNLAVSYQDRFERLAELGDIDAAITYHNQAILLTPDGHADKPTRLNNLGVAYQGRFEQLGNLDDIRMAVELQSQAVSLTDDGDPQKPVFLGSLGVSYQTRYGSLKQLSDLNKAIELQSLAVLDAPERHATKPGWLNNLGISLTNRYRHLKDILDIDTAIGYQTRAVSLTPGGFTKKGHYLNNLASSYAIRFEHLRNVADLDLSNKYFGEAVRSSTGLPSMKLKMALIWSKTYFMRDRSSRSLDSYKQVMDLIPQVVWLGETIDRRYKLLDEIQDGIAAEAAAVAISLNEYDLALEWLECGRSIVWNQMLQLRAPLGGLSEVDPALADELREIAQELEAAAAPRSGHASSSLNSPSLEKLAQHHRRLAERWDELLGKARQITGLNILTMPRYGHNLQKRYQSDATVVINLHKTRCDALALLPGSNSVTHIPLPSFSFESALEMKEQLFNLLNRGDIRTRSNRRPFYPDRDLANDRFKFILTSLWLNLVKPILDRLGFLQAHTPAELPRLTWCATGPLSFLPLHAAGLYDEPQEKAFDYIVSSYTPTLISSSHSTQALGDFSGILLVGQSATSGCEPLPGTVKELDRIQKLAGQLPLLRVDEHRATATTVLQAMEKYSWVHLACHASQDAAVPTASGFYLHDEKLDLAAIMRKNFKHGGLAFLSACQTAAGDPQLPDEAVHLAAGLITAGYSAVVATLWSIRDADAPVVSDSFYTCMLDGSTPDVRKAARALHKAVGDLREEVGEGEFARWVPFIHIEG